jgi:hypothetical protein
VRVHTTIANGIAQVQWEALPEHQRNIVDLDET